MKQLLGKLHGDKAVWAAVVLLALFSFLPVFSASSNLAYMRHGSGNPLTYLLKHAGHMLLGFFIIYRTHKVPYHYFRGINKLIFLPVSWLMLLFTYFFGVESGSATRWIKIPFVGITFQPSSFAFIALMIYVSGYLAKKDVDTHNFKKSFLQLWVPVGITVGLILPNNFSTSALIFLMVLMLVVIGKYSSKYILYVLGIGFVLGLMYYGTAKAYEKINPEHTPAVFKRVTTWENRIKSYGSTNVDEDDIYQIERAKTAIATGGIYGLGFGKSVQKNFLPQSSSDFIFAIIVEETGLVGALAIISIYLFLLFRFVVDSHKAKSYFGKLLIIALGFPIIFQAFINMGVAVELLPTTGQTLPLISSGGSSIWMTCVAVGIILSVTKKEDEIAQELDEKQKREEALQRIIDRELQADDDDQWDENQDKINQMKASIKNKIEEEDNPMQAVKGK